jgi:hypothetical protein
MVGSWIGRAMLALPALFFAVGAGALVAGATRDGSVGGAVAGLILVVVTARVAVAGVRVVPDADLVVVRSLVRTTRFAVSDIAAVQAVPTTQDGPAVVSFLLRDGRRCGSLALAYLSPSGIDRLVADLRAARSRSPFVLEVDRARLRPAIS